MLLKSWYFCIVNCVNTCFFVLSEITLKTSIDCVLAIAALTKQRQSNYSWPINPLPTQHPPSTTHPPPPWVICCCRKPTNKATLVIFPWQSINYIFPKKRGRREFLTNSSTHLRLVNPGTLFVLGINSWQDGKVGGLKSKYPKKKKKGSFHQMY